MLWCILMNMIYYLCAFRAYLGRSYWRTGFGNLLNFISFYIVGDSRSTMPYDRHRSVDGMRCSVSWSLFGRMPVDEVSQPLNPVPTTQSRHRQVIGWWLTFCASVNKLAELTIQLFFFSQSALISFCLREISIEQRGNKYRMPRVSRRSSVEQIWDEVFWFIEGHRAAGWNRKDLQNTVVVCCILEVHYQPI